MHNFSQLLLDCLVHKRDGEERKQGRYRMESIKKERGRKKKERSRGKEVKKKLREDEIQKTEDRSVQDSEKEDRQISG